MKWIKGICLVAVVGLLTGNAVGAGSDIEKPAVLDDALLTVTVSDLHGFIDGAGSMAAQVSPTMNGEMLKGMIGVQIGDPGLTGISPGKGLAVVALDLTNVFAIIELNEAQMPACTNVLAAKGIPFKYSEGVLVVGQTVDHVAKGEAYADAVQNTLLAKRSPALRIALNPSDSIVKNDAQIQGMLKMMPMMMGMGMQQPGVSPDGVQSLTKVLEAELRIFLSLAKQIESAEITLAPVDGSIRISEVLSPVPGSNLATFCNSPKVNPWNPKLHAGLLGKGAIQADFCLANPEAVSALYMAEADQLVKEMKLDSEQVEKFLGSVKKWLDIYGGTGCKSILSSSGSPGIDASILLEVKDEALALEALKTMSADMAVFTDLYKSFGMEIVLDFKENVREHAGVKIHQLKMNMSMEQASATEQAQFEAMGLTNLQYEIAIADGVMAYAMGAGRIEELIDQIKNPKASAPALKSRSLYPAGAGFYCDYNVGEYLAFVAALMPEIPENPIPQFAAMLKGAEPITMAGYRNNGRLMCSVNVPGDLLAKIGQIVMSFSRR